MESRLDRFEYRIDELIIGGTLEALLYAWFTGATVICSNPREPFFFERFTPEAKLDHIGLENEITTLNSPKGPKIFGPKKSEIWRRLFMLLSMSGQAPVSSTAQSIRIEDGVVKVITSHSRLARFRYKKVKIFDPSEVDAVQKNRNDHNYMVLDWMKVNTGKIHPYQFLTDEEDFINQIYFYAVTQRGGKDFKDLVAVSYLKEDKLKDYSYSDTYAKFKTEHLLKEKGIRGRKNGYKNGVSYHLNAKVTPTLREVFCVDKYHMDLDKNVTHNKLTDEEILDKFKGPPKNKSVRKLLRYWG